MTARPECGVRSPKPEVGRARKRDSANVAQKSKMESVARVASLLVVIAGAIFLASCGSGGGPGTNVPLPVVTVSPASTSLPTGGSLQFTANVVSPTSTTLSWYVNNILGGNATIGTINQAGLYSAPASIPSPATVTVKAVSSAETSPYGSAIVTITPPVNATVTVSPTNTSTPVGTTVQFVATVTGIANTAVTWSVNGVAGGSTTVGTISAAGLYTAPSAAPNPPTVAVTATSAAQMSESASTTVTMTANNTAPLYVNFGLNGNTGNPNTAAYNGLYTTIDVCLPGTRACQTVPNVLVDTSSVGLRVLNSILTTVPATALGTVKDSTGNQVEECSQFGDTSYTWGPVLIADVNIGGETASSVPIQVIGDTTFAVPAATCLGLGPGPNIDTVAALGANAILGVGTSVQDCGPICAGGQTFSGYPYYVCPKNVCQIAPLPVVKQVANPVAFFPKDNNGVMITLPSLPAPGAPSLPYLNVDGTGLVPAGQLILGVGTESNNALGSATLYAVDANGNFSNVTYNGFSYPSGGILNSSSNALRILNPLATNILDCMDNPYYCPSSTTAVALTVYGTNGTSGAVNLSIANADMLFANNPSYAAFSNLGGPTGAGISTDSVDLGLPFFFGRSVFVGIAGTAVPNKASAPNGYFAF
jgi:hypothetical protein